MRAPQEGPAPRGPCPLSCGHKKARKRRKGGVKEIGGFWHISISHQVLNIWTTQTCLSF